MQRRLRSIDCARVTWNLGGGITHIGMVVNEQSPQTGRNLIVHNIGQGPQMEDVLFNWKIIGHYRYPGENFHQ